MKVYIGKYKNWIGPYQIAELIPFISEDTQYKIGEWLSKTWLNGVCEKIHDIRGERTVKVRIDKYDTWSMDNTLSLIILPMLKQLKESKHGSPMVDEEDLPAHMRHTLKKGPDDYETDDHWIHYKWEWILNEMIFAFESINDNSWEDKFYHGEPMYIYDPVDANGEPLEDEAEATWYTMKQNNPDYWVDYDGIKMYNDRIDNGLRLFGKYFRNLWD